MFSGKATSVLLAFSLAFFQGVRAEEIGISHRQQANFCDSNQDMLEAKGQWKVWEHKCFSEIVLYGITHAPAAIDNDKITFLANVEVHSRSNTTPIIDGDNTAFNVRYDEAWEKRPPHVRAWFQNLMQPDNPTVPCCGDADAYEADSFEVEGDHYVAIIAGQGPPIVAKKYIKEGTRIPVPNHKMKWDKGNPTGHGIIFIGVYGQALCYVTPGGV